MSLHNFRDLGSSEDEHFLQNFSPRPDLFHEFCRVDSRENPLEDCSYEVKEQMQQELRYKGQLNEGQRSHSSRRSKQKKKVFYRDKMAQLMKPGEYVKQEYKYVTFTANDEPKAPISKEEQLKRNRESAKNSRQRKKQYVSFLEQKNDENLKLIQELSFKLQQVTLERDRLKQDSHADIKTFFKSKAQAYENLEQALKSPIATSEDIRVVIGDMMLRFGTSGSERMGAINYYMNEIIEVMISDIHKYFLNCSAFLQGVTPSNPPKSIDNDVMRILRLDLTKLNALMLKFKERFTKEATVFKDLTQQLYRVFKSIENQGRVIELVFAQMAKEIEPKALGELIVWFEQNKFTRQVKRVRKQWIQQLKTGEEVIETIRKQPKVQYY